MRRNTTIELDLSKNIENGIKFYTKQFDDITLKVKIYDGVDEVDVSNQSATVYVLKEDGTVIEQKENIKIDDNALIIDFTKQATTAIGRCQVEVVLRDNEGSVSTSTVSYMVGERLSATISEIIKSEDSIDSLDIIEAFIQTSNIDIVEIKEALQLIKDNIEDVKDTVETNLDSIIDRVQALEEEVIKSITDTSGEAIEVVNNAREDVEGLIDEVNTLLDDVESAKNNVLDEIASANAIVEDTKEQAIVDINNAKGRAITEIGEAKTTAITDIDNSKTSAIADIDTSKTGAITEMTTKKDEIIEEISSIETGTVEEVEVAVEAAKKRLQEQTIQCNWELQQAAKEEKDSIEGVSREEQSKIQQETTNYIERINQAGSDIVEMVEGLDASIEQGLREIENTTRAGKNEISTLYTEKITAIREEGQEILDLVSNIEEITGDHVERINKSAENASNRLESLTSSCKSEIRTETNEQKELIKEAGNEKLEEINSILGVSKGEVEELLETTRSEINNHRTQTNEMITNLKNNSITELTNKKDAYIDELLGAEVELKEDFEETANSYLTQIDEKGNARLDALQNMIDNIDRLQESINKDLETSTKRAEMLDNKISDVDAKVNEIQPVLNNLNDMRNVCISLQQENQEANENIEELDFLHIEADTRIVELRLLIEEAKQYETVLIDYIGSRGGNHEEIENRLSALEEAINELDLSIYATKEELEAYATKEELNSVINSVPQEGYKGKIKASVMVAIDHEGAFNNLPEPTEIEGNEYIGKFLYSYVSGSSTYYRAMYFYNNPSKNYNPHIYATVGSGTTGETVNYYFSQASTSSSYNTVKIYEKKTAGATWSTSTSTSSFSENASTKIYHNDMPIYTDVNKSGIYRESSVSEFIGNVDSVEVEGRYLVQLSVNEYSDIQGLPDIELTRDIDTTLYVYRNNDEVFQEIAIEGITYTRKLGNVWTGVNMKDYAKSKVIGVIETPISKTFINNIYATCPQPNNHKKHYAQIDFKDIATEKCYRWRIYNKQFNIYKFVSTSTSQTVGVANCGYGYIERYVYANGAWSLATDSNAYVTGSKGIEVIYCSADMYKGLTYNTCDTDIIVRKADGADSVRRYEDFNDADSFGCYDVNGEFIINSPVEGSITGALDVAKNNDRIVQTLTTKDTIYTRECVDKVWNEWREIPNKENISNMIDEKIEATGVNQGVVSFNGYFGEGFKLPEKSLIPISLTGDLDEKHIPEGSEVKHSISYKYYSSSNYQHTKIWFFCDLNDSSDGKYISYDEKYTLTLNGMTKGVDYIASNTTSSSSVLTGGSSATISSINMSNNVAYIYDFNFNIFNADGSKILVNNANTEGINNFNEVSKNGYYTIDVTNAEYSSMTAAPVLSKKSERVKGYLEIVDNTQICNLNGELFTRLKGENWKSENSNSVSKDVIKKIGINNGIKTPELFKSMPADIRYFNQAVTKYTTMFRIDENKYGVIRSTNNSYYKLGYNKSTGRLYFGSSVYEYSQYDEYNAETGLWTTKEQFSSSYLSNASIACNPEYFTIYHCDHPMYVVTSTSLTNDIYQDITVANYDIEETLVDFNNADMTGYYNIEINEGETVSNPPVESELKGILKVVKSNDDIYQEVTTNDCITYKRNKINGEWTNWSKQLTEADIMSLINQISLNN